MTTALFATLAVPANASNYLVVVADDLGIDKVSSYASDYPAYEADANYVPATPTIDHLGEVGVRFRQAWANPSCTPTRASLHTGAHAVRHHLGKAILDTDPGLDPTLWSGQLLGILFEEAGYATGMFGKWHLGTQDAALVSGVPRANTLFDTPPHPDRLGFSVFDGTIGGMLDPTYTDWPRMRWDRNATGLFRGSEVQSQEYVTEETTAAALDWINGQSDPWLAIVAYHAPHSSLTQEWTYEALPPWPGVGTSCAWTGSCPAGEEPLGVYQALVEHLDWQVGELLAGIEQPALDDTIVVFLGDNGTPETLDETTGAPLVQEEDFQFHGKGTVFEGGVRVPFIVTDGGHWRDEANPSAVTAGILVDAPVQVLDLHRTLLEDAGIAIPTATTYDSESLWDCLSGTGGHCDRPAEFVYTEKFEATRDASGAVTQVVQGLGAVRWGPADKLIVEYDGGCLESYYYDVETDTYEATAQTGWSPTRRARLRNQFTSYHDDATDWAYGETWCP